MLRYRVLFEVIVQYLCRLFAGVQIVTGSEKLRRVSVILCLGQIRRLLREIIAALTDTVLLDWVSVIM